MNIRNFFENADMCRKRYVVLHSYHNLPRSIAKDKPLELLVDVGGVDEMFKRCELMQRGNSKNNFFSSPSYDVSFSVNLYEKGTGLLPERFESQLLDQRLFKDNSGGVYYLPDHLQIMVRLFLDFHYGRKFDDDPDKFVFERFIEDRVGLKPPSNFAMTPATA